MKTSVKWTCITLLVASILTIVFTTNIATPTFGESQATVSEASVESYPNQTIEVVVPAGAGGDTDLGARLLSQYVGEELGVNMVVSNIAGAGGSVGSREILDARADGHQVLFFHNNLLINQLFGVSDFDHRDFKIAAISTFDMGDTFIINADAPYQDASDLADYAEQNPDELYFGTEVGGYTHLQMMAFERETGASFRLIDVGGASDKIVALLGNQVDVIPIAYGVTTDYIENGDFSSVGVLAEESRELYDNTPSMAEQGIDIEFEKFFFFAFPKETPDEIVETFSQAVKEVVENNEEYQSRAESYYTIPEYLDGEEAFEHMEGVREYYTELIQTLEADEAS
ncbi:LOW QUALITY PROTEIN: tricarboxylate transport protein TctC [Geomicrobium sp. JCM 19038]|nr:LOW QUALITY PROTEIN: tricarboxylate transport protein TctC [Geomicrobium sp. JCM 19038]